MMPSVLPCSQFEGDEPLRTRSDVSADPRPLRFVMDEGVDV